MTDTTITIGSATLTTEHAASSYNQPVLIWDGEAHGPGDALPDRAGIAWKYVEDRANDSDHPLIREFISLGRTFSKGPERYTSTISFYVTPTQRSEIDALLADPESGYEPRDMSRWLRMLVTKELRRWKKSKEDE